MKGRQLLTLVMAATLFVSPSVITFAGEDQIIQRVSANGTRNLPPFAVKDRWEIRWEANDRLSIWVFDVNGKPLDLAVQQNKAGAGSSFQPKGGMYYLTVTGGNDWTITVVQLP